MLNAKRPHFFEGFNPTSSSERLKIPSKFIKQMEGRTFGTASLVGPSGNIWCADLIHEDDNVFFHEGWSSFVQDHCLEHGDLLVFRYDGNLFFTVHVFDQTACEKEAALNADCSQNLGLPDSPNGRKRDRVERTPFDAIVEGIPKKMRSSQARSECVSKVQEEGQRLDGVAFTTGTCQTTTHARETGMCDSSSRNSMAYALPLQSVPQDSSGAVLQYGNGKEPDFGSSVRNSTPRFSVSEAEELARSFNSPCPNFTKTMKGFNVSGSYTLNIPYQFSMAHLPLFKVKIVLRNQNGECWTVNSVPSTKVHTSHTFCGGWMAFIRGNNINMGDILIFELMAKYELHVSILRVRKEGLECQNGKPTVRKVTNGHGTTSDKFTDRLPKKLRGNARKVQSQQMNKINVSDKRNLEASIYKDKSNGSLAKGSAVRGSSGKLATRMKVGPEEIQGSYRGWTSLKSGPEEKRAAESFVSSFPYFVRVMKKFNTSNSYTLKVPYQFSMSHLPKCKTEIVLRNLRGQTWPVNSVPCTRVQTLHTFCGGWGAFVRDNDIQMGDTCVFELIGKCEMLVHVFRLGQQGLDYQSGLEDSNDLTLASFVANRGLQAH